MRTQDIGQVIKFESTVEVVQPFTSDKAALQNAIAAPFGANGSTKLYDAAFKAVDDTALNTTTGERSSLRPTARTKAPRCRTRPAAWTKSSPTP
jgi:hypothetical protein